MNSYVISKIVITIIVFYGFLKSVLKIVGIIIIKFLKNYIYS